eukprot:scaffold45397_cov65-Phaeocystis_antarctica.AAC.1
MYELGTTPSSPHDGGGGDGEGPLLWLPSATAAACAGPVVTARSIGKNCGGTAPKRTRWRVVELGFNECLTVPSSGPMSMFMSARTPSAVFACMFTRERREAGGMGGRK